MQKFKEPEAEVKWQLGLLV